MSHFRYQLRLAILIVTLCCTLFAWQRCRLIVRQYQDAGRVNAQDRQKLATYRLVRLTEVVETYRKLVAANPDHRPLKDSYQKFLLQLESEMAICELELAGFEVTQEGSPTRMIEISATAHLDSEIGIHKLLTCLKTIRSCPGYISPSD